MSAKNEMATAPQNQSPAAAAMTSSQRFTNRVISEYAATAHQTALELNDAQRRLIQGYFVVINRALKTAEEERLRKNAKNSDHKYDNLIPYDWAKVNMTDLALDAVHYARMGLDMQEKNHLFPIPYANKKGGFYDITFMLGYGGIQFIAEKYAIHAPQSVTIEVVYSNDFFTPLKKSVKNPIENYEFEITSPFDRGEIVGGFGYIQYDEPSKNTLVIMSRKDILKRKPQYASANFWGGKTTVWENGKKVEVEVEGWFDEMCRKTLIREVYSGKYIPRDPSKIDDNYQYMREREVVFAEAEIEQDAFDNANMTPLPAPANNPVIITNQNTAEHVEQQIGEPAAQSVTRQDGNQPIDDVDF
jgi:recombination protein RecT